MIQYVNYPPLEKGDVKIAESIEMEMLCMRYGYSVEAVEERVREIALTIGRGVTDTMAQPVYAPYVLEIAEPLIKRAAKFLPAHERTFMYGLREGILEKSAERVAERKTKENVFSIHPDTLAA